MHNAQPRAQRGLAKPNVPRQQQLSTSTSGDTATFLSFVRLLANKSEEEQRMLVQVAMQEAATPAAQRQPAPGQGFRRSVSSASLDGRRNPLRRSASLDGSDFGGRASGGGLGGVSAVGVPYGAQLVGAAHSAAGLDGRPRSADAVSVSQQPGLGQHTWGMSHPGGGAGGPRQAVQRQRQAQARAAAAAAQLQQQFVRRAAASILQAHWRGWQHRCARSRHGALTPRAPGRPAEPT